eukprot:TRINITY_DN308_c0_g1_i6.p1 TRINITY_DN308_c0_g1~~TRINITY_DN308_c0_g1_i6.p1  ORF type:complete len:4231 (+),score=876.63 TRINITY_DN308_c0_g1_i6:183-12875(+)
MADQRYPPLSPDRGENGALNRQEKGYSRLKSHEAQLRNQLQPPPAFEPIFDESLLPSPRRPVTSFHAPRVRIPDVLRTGNLRIDRSEPPKKKKFLSDLSPLLSEHSREVIRSGKPGELPPLTHESASMLNTQAQTPTSFQPPSSKISRDLTSPRMQRPSLITAESSASSKRKKIASGKSSSAPTTPQHPTKPSSRLSHTGEADDNDGVEVFNSFNPEMTVDDDDESALWMDPTKLTPSERIGCFYTPNAYGLGCKRLQASKLPSIYTLNPSLEDTQNLSETKPSLEETLMSPDGTEDGGYLPLEFFDVSDETEKTPQEWVEYVQKGNLGARTKFLRGTRWVWKKCKVISYDESDFSFQVEWCDTGKRKTVTRLNLLFDTESEQEFENRARRANERRKVAEAELRLQMYLDDNPADMITPMSDEAMGRIVSRCGYVIPPYNQDEIRTLYLNSMKRAIYYYNYMNPFERQKTEPLRLPIPPSPNPAPELGVVDVPRYPYRQIMQLAQDRQFRSEGLLVDIMLQVSKIWEQYHNNRLIDDVLNGLFLPCELSALFDHQANHMDDIQLLLLQEWLNSVESNVFLRLELPTDHHQRRIPDQAPTTSYALPDDKLRKFLRLISLIMSDQLRKLVVDSLQSFVALIERYRWTSEEAVDSTRTPLLVIRLIVKDDEFVFEPSFEQLKATIFQIYDNVITNCERFPRIDASKGFRNPDSPEFLLVVSRTDEIYISGYNKINNILEENFEGPRLLASLYKEYEYLLTMNRGKYASEFLEKKPTLDLYREEIDKHYQTSREILDKFMNEMTYSMIKVQLEDLKFQFSQKAVDLGVLILDLLANETRELLLSISSRCQEMHTRLLYNPANVEELMEMFTYISSCEGQLNEVHQELDLVRSRLQILEEYSYNQTESDFNLTWETMSWPKKMIEHIQQTRGRLNEHKIVFMRELRDQQSEFKTKLEKFAHEIAKFETMDEIEDLEENADQVQVLHQLLEEARSNVEVFTRREGLFEWKTTTYDILGHLKERFEPYAQVWTIANEFQSNYPKWMEGPFLKTDPEKIQDLVQTWIKSLYKLGKNFSEGRGPVTVIQQVSAKLEEFKKHIPLMICLRNPGMKERHWNQLSTEVGIPIKADMNLTLRKLVAMNLNQHQEKIEEIGDVAGKEYALERALDKMRADWKEVCFDHVKYRETGASIVRAVDDIQMLLDDHIVKVQTMRSSPYIAPFFDRCKEWEETLKTVQDVMDEWLNCQRNWLYLEPIFCSEDIMRQMPVEGRKFQNVDDRWRKIMAQCEENANVMVLCCKPEIGASLKEANVELEHIHHGLNSYLESKRLSFPRFFFLSNDELLEILSETRDPRRIQPHLRKCFEGINALTFAENLDITEMKSSEGEVVAFKKPIPCAAAGGLVEKWLLEVEHEMKASLKHISGQAVQAYLRAPREKWVMQWPGQIVLCASQVYWTKHVTEAIRSGGNKGLKQLYGKLNKQLEQVIAIVRGDIPSMSRITLGALVVIDVHARDVVNAMVDSGVMTDDDFEWQSQLRYYWEEETIKVRMVNAMFDYRYEYLGNSPRLVITPLTDRCYRTLLGAVQMNLGGAPEGPAGTGKTESTKDLAKALATHCVVFNCSDGLDYLAMGKFFKGLASSGAWSCFDEFNRIDLEVLSVIAQQILNIQTAIKEKKVKFVFEGTELILQPTCCVFITMNPGYAGRSELPDNLKALFRPVAMMVPDYALIAEISLYSYGFHEARPLARKIVATYRLSSEQLSSQDHYDFGMRAVKAVLTAAGALKRKYLETDENILMLRAINDVNLPKFLSQDLPLFEGIISDIFPGVTLPPPDYEHLMEGMKVGCSSMNIQPVPAFLTKCIQLYETINVRHGLMVVGYSFAGKTCAIRVLAKALGELKKKDMERSVKCHTMNPKSITMGELYGYFDAVSHEWYDGVLANTFRMCAFDTSGERNWVIFDGPVDAVWIENMNTVLDDNKKLCLMSGEIIQMSNSMNLIFEVQDLAVASPATVSRCGMVYMEPSSIGWKPLFVSWTSTLPASLKNYLELLESFFDWIVNPTLEFVKKSCKEPVFMPEINRVQSAMRILETLMKDFGLCGDTVLPSSHETTSLIECLALFSMVWSLGANVDYAGRKMFDAHIRTMMDKNQISKPFPLEGQVYDFVFSKEKSTWVQWMDTIPEFQIAAGTPFHEIIVPTLDTVRFSYLLDLHLLNHIPIIFAGPTGTGKTIIIQNKITDMDSEKYTSILMQFSGQTTAAQTQDIIDGKLDKRRKGIFGPPLGKHCIIFIDDVNMPAKEKFGAQPPIELVRQWLDHGGWYDRKTTQLREIIDIQLVCAMGPPGGGRTFLTNRFMRHFNVMSFTEQDDKSLQRIFDVILTWFLSPFSGEIQSIREYITKATVDIYLTITRELLPTPAKSHYLYNLRDLSKVFQGVMTADPIRVSSAPQLIRLWMHECSRVFSDRLINEEDNKWFKVLMGRMLQKYFDADYSTFVEEGETLLYADFVKKVSGKGIYDDVSDMGTLSTAVQNLMDDYNAINNTPLKLVLFTSALEHICRISKVIKQPFGHALLIGMGGSGRRSLTRLVAHIAEYDLFEVEITKNYGKNEWKDDMKKILCKAGEQGKQVVFLLADSQLKEESFLEDVNNILNKGEVPNLFAADEVARINDTMNQVLKASGKVDSKLSPFAMFVERCRKNVHIVFCMSAIGEQSRNRLRNFPSLVNCCAIDWFSPWPADALRSVALKQFEEIEMAEEVRKGVIELCVYFHKSIQIYATHFLQELRRHYYVTPTSYLQLMDTFTGLLSTKRKEIYDAKRRYEVGLQKLLFTEASVKEMQIELENLQPVLIRTQADTSELMIKLEGEQLQADETKKVVAAEEAEATKKAESAKSIKDECETDLAAAIPALNAAIKALETLNKNDITEVKAMKNPPVGVRITLSAVCVMMGYEPVKVPGPKPGTKVDDYWVPAQKMMSDMSFLKSLYDYDKENIPKASIDKLQPFMKNEDFQPEKIKQASKAAHSLCLWVRAMETYYFVSQGVKPKKQALELAESTLAATEKSLAEKRAQLKEVEDRIKGLMDNLAASKAKKEDLSRQVDDCTVKLERAQKLIGGLGGEKTRWTKTAEQLQIAYDNSIGDVLMTSGIVAYAGAFTSAYRYRIVQEWMKQLQKMKIPCSSDFSVVNVLGDPNRIRQWVLAGLPNDKFSIENAIMSTKSNRWPLMIDPQGQAVKWIKNMYGEKLMILNQEQSDFLRNLENAITFGAPVLLANVQEELHPILEPLLLKKVYKKGGSSVIQLGDSIVEYHPDFKFFITTKLRNPHYKPEIFVKVNIVNFMSTPDALEDQLLGIVMEKERPELEEDRLNILKQNTENKRQLQEIEDRILHLLSNAQGNILDDETLINALGVSKKTSDEISKKVKEADAFEKSFEDTRNGYRPVANRGSTLFFCIAELPNVDPMYQYSLAWYIALFIRCIAEAPKGVTLEERLKILNEYITYAVYCGVCRSLFEKDKLLFSFSLCIAILMSRKEIDPVEFRFLLTGGLALDSHGKKPNPAPGWISEKAWTDVFELSKLPSFSELPDDIIANLQDWKTYYQAPEPQSRNLPGKWDRILSPFQKMLILRSFRADKILPAIQDYVLSKMGQRFVESPGFDLVGSYKESSPTTPLLFVLSPGADPVSLLYGLAEAQGMNKKITGVSLGQGQGPIADKMIQSALKSGGWVILQNCHLALSWMPELEKICDDLQRLGPNATFRLWLTSMPSEKFPLAILQDSIKMTNEPPKGLKNNILRSLQSVDEKIAEECKRPRHFKRLLFGLTFFHAVVQERRKYGALGWNISYEFNESDLRISVGQLRMFLDDYAETPFKALKYLTGEANYGGRVTDDHDRRTLNHLLSDYYNEDVFKERYNLSPSGAYYIPEDGPLEKYVDYVRTLPLNDPPEVFGLHDNANITKAIGEATELFTSLLSTQARANIGKGKSPEEVSAEVADEILTKFPANFNVVEALKKYPVTYSESMNTVLVQELYRFNNLMTVVRESLVNVQKAVKGLVVMSEALERTSASLCDGRVPALWSEKSYPSLKPLGGYVNDLLARINFLQEWINEGAPPVFWISGFYFTQSFLTGVMQNYARRHKVPVDLLRFDFEVLREDFQSIHNPPADGCYIYGLFLEGARWGSKEGTLVESRSQLLFEPLPVVHMKPCEAHQVRVEGTYRCPVYKTSARRGVLSTTGHSTNFVTSLLLPTDRGEKHWVKRGVALLCQLDN